MNRLKKIGYLAFFSLALAATPVLAYVMSSTNYRMERDSINIGGGLSDSASYISQSSIGGIGSGSATSTSFSLLAGYQQMEQTSISLTVPAAAVMSPSINSNVGGIAYASANLSVATNNSSGYTLQIKASTTPALKSLSDSFADYVTAGADPDYNWTVSSSTSEFGFSPEGVDIMTRYKDNGSACNQPAGGDTADHCWDHLNASYSTIAQSALGNLPSGSATAIKFRAEAGSAVAQPNGNYSATITFTAFAN